MNRNRNTLSLFLLGSLASLLTLSGTAFAVNVVSITGFWQDDNGNYVEIQRDGPNAIAIMRSEAGRKNWMRGSMDLSGDDIYLVKKRGTRTVGTVRGDLVRGIGATRIRWNSGRVWRKSSLRAYNDSLHVHDHPGGYSGATTAVSVTRLPGRWQTGDKTIVDITQKGDALSVRVVSQQGSRHGHHHPWTNGHGRISDSRLSLDCYNGTRLEERLSGTYVSGSRGERQIKWSNGDVWYERNEDFRLITQPVVGACKLPLTVVDTVIPRSPTSTWQYQNGGYFHHGKDGRWEEYDSRGNIRHHYREARRSDAAVTLYDGRRHLYVQLRKDECFFHEVGDDEWRRLSKGRWSSRAPSHPEHNHRHNASRHEETVTVTERESVKVNVGIERFFQGVFGRRN